MGFLTRTVQAHTIKGVLEFHIGELMKKQSLTKPCSRYHVKKSCLQINYLLNLTYGVMF